MNAAPTLAPVGVARAQAPTADRRLASETAAEEARGGSCASEIRKLVQTAANKQAVATAMRCLITGEIQTRRMASEGGAGKWPTRQLQGPTNAQRQRIIETPYDDLDTDR